MWSPGLLFVLVALAGAAQNNAWRENTEYEYQVYGRSLASLNEISNNYTGIIIKAQLSVRPRSDGNLGAKISQAQYAQIHTKLHDGWDSYIPDSELNYEQFSLSSKPFQILINNGAVHNLVVESDITNWEANVIKGIVSQLQLDTEAQNLIPSSINTLRQQGQNDAVFKTLEESVIGVSETLYEIHPLPKHAINYESFALAEKNADFIEVVKTKNFTHSTETPSFHFGWHGIQGFGIDNKIANFFSRVVISRAIVTGSMDKFTVQEIITEDHIHVRPTKGDSQWGSVMSLLNVSLLSIQPQNQPFAECSNPVQVGLVYRYNQPFDSNKARPSNDYNHAQDAGSAEALVTSELLGNKLRFKRSLHQDSSSSNSDSSSLSQEGEYSPFQDKPTLEKSPGSPLLPFTVGFDGQSITKKQNVKEDVSKLAQRIGQEFQNPQDIYKHNTVDKFVRLSTILKLLNNDEIQEVIEQLYTEQQSGAEAVAWAAFCNALAQAGTGPALLNIAKMIKQGKIYEEAAAEIVAYLAASTYQPTEDYMKKFFELVQNQEIMPQQYLNESVILSYSTLVRQVYVDKETSYSKYPVYSFGSYRTRKGIEFVQKEVIPYLTRQLEKAVDNGDNQKIHTYIRALGNVGHQEILRAFEPYLEGQKQASQFQRVLMVLALDKLTQIKPKVARSVLYRIYENQNDFEQVRVAAVYQLMRTNPSASLLHRIAIATNFDPNNYVNSAVKSAIQQASHLDDHEYQLRAAAKSAEPFLTSQEFGFQYSKKNIQTYVSENLQLYYKLVLDTFGSKDSWLPNGFNFIFVQQFGGNKQPLFNVRAIVSSVEDLVSVLQQQTKEYQTLLQQKQSKQSIGQEWTSEYIAKLLNLQNKQREQLEGNFYWQMGELQKIWSFDNHTIENFTQVVQDWEQQLKNGNQVEYSKMVINQPQTIALPTIWGLPFMYSYSVPALVGVKAKIKANAQPQLVSDELFEMPKTINAEYEVSGFLSGKVKSELGFFTPFNQQRYSAGYDKYLQVALPLISGKIQVDVENKQARLEFENADNRQNLDVLRFSTLPYTAHYDIYGFNTEKEIIGKQNPYQFNAVFGEKSTGIAFNVQMYSDVPIDLALIYDEFKQQRSIPDSFNSIINQDLQNIEIVVGINSPKSSSNKVVVQLGYQEQNVNMEKPPQNNRNWDKLAEDSWERQRQFLSNVSSDINSGNACVIDAAIQFKGQKVFEYDSTVAFAKSMIDRKELLSLQLQQNDQQQQQPQKVNLYTSINLPLTSSLDLNQAMKSESTIQSYVKAVIDNGNGSPSEIHADVVLSKSQNRKQYLMEQPQYKYCQRQMQEESNNQLPVCAVLTAQANLLDQFAVNIQYENITPRVVNQTYQLWSLVRQSLIPRVSEDILKKDSQSNKNHLDIQGQFSPDLSSVNVSIMSAYGDAQIRNVPTNQWSRAIFVSHPVFHLSQRLAGQFFKYDTYKPICVVDNSAATTLDNKTYSLNLGQEWSVLFQYVPRQPSFVQDQPQQSVQEQMNQQIESYIVYVRTSQPESSQKEIRIVVQNPNTNGEVVDVILQPSSSSRYPEVSVNGQRVQYGGQEPQVYDKFLQVYPLPNEEVLLEIYDAFYVIYDGVRAKLVVTDSKFKDASRGLCGTFTGEEETDLISPQNCLLEDSQDFVDSWTIPKGQRTKRMSQQSQECVQETVKYANVVSSKDISSSKLRSWRRSCTKHQTQFMIEGDQTCFTLRPQPLCKQGCIQRGSIEKPIPVHCLKNSSTSEMWRNQIRRGASPDFSRKLQTKTITMRIPLQCMP